MKNNKQHEFSLKFEELKIIALSLKPTVSAFINAFDDDKKSMGYKQAKFYQDIYNRVDNLYFETDLKPFISGIISFSPSELYEVITFLNDYYKNLICDCVNMDLNPLENNTIVTSRDLLHKLRLEQAHAL